MGTYMLVRYKVRDFSAWRRVYDIHLPKRNEAGLSEKILFRGAVDINEVIILFEVRDLTRAKAFTESSDLRDIMMKAGVVDRPDIYFLKDQSVGLKTASGF
jgi:hypothetical protein